MKDFIIFKNLEGKYVTLPEYVEASKKDSKVEQTEEAKVEETKTEESNEEPVKDVVYYVTNEQQQSQYINMFKENGMDAVLLTHNIDQPFISQLEQAKEDIKFMRIDADVTESFKEEVSKEDEESLKAKTEALTEKFRKVLGKENLEVKVEKLKNAEVSSMITLSEETRRMQDMMKMYSMYGAGADMFGGGETLVLNANNSLVQYVFENKDDEKSNLFCEQLYDLALISHKPLDAAAMTKFIKRSNDIMNMLAKQ